MSETETKKNPIISIAVKYSIQFALFMTSSSSSSIFLVLWKGQNRHCQYIATFFVCFQHSICIFCLFFFFFFVFRPFFSNESHIHEEKETHMYTPSVCVAVWLIAWFELTQSFVKLAPFSYNKYQLLLMCVCVCALECKIFPIHGLRKFQIQNSVSVVIPMCMKG